MLKNKFEASHAHSEGPDTADWFRQQKEIGSPSVSSVGEVVAWALSGVAFTSEAMIVQQLAEEQESSNATCINQLNERSFRCHVGFVPDIVGGTRCW